MVEKDRAVRVRANELIGLMASGADWEGARRLAELMAELRYFPAPMQRPNNYVEGLSAKPIHKTSGFDVVEFLEANAQTIREEVMTILQPDAKAAFADVEEPLVEDGGCWQEIVFYEAGVRSERAANHLPKSASVIDQLPDAVRAAGVIMISRLAPNTHIVPHCGETNDRLRLHMGIKVPPDALLRVGTETVSWTVDQCIVFDDSFEHEVWNLGPEERLVLIVDLPHPDVSPDAVAVDKLESAPQRRFARLLGEAHLRGVYLDDQCGEPRLLPDTFLSSKLHRYLDELAASSVELSGDGQLNIDKKTTA